MERSIINSWVYFHPRQYRQALVVIMTVLTMSGLLNMSQPVVARWQAERAIAIQPQSVAHVVTQPQRDSSLPPSLPSYRPSDQITSPVQLSRVMNAAWFGDEYWPDLQSIWTHESGFNPSAQNRSGACGIPQALPCSKITDHSIPGQIEWGLGYIQKRYGNPANAWRFWQTHHWY